MNCKTWGGRPSQWLKAPPLRNDLAAYQFDGAVMYVGLTIENALQEREEYGPMNARQWRAKYTLKQLLDPEFRLSRAGTNDGGLKAMVAAHPGLVGHWKQVAQEV